jgi:hypothetical protein
MTDGRATPHASARDELWDVLGIDPERISREEFDACLDVYDGAAGVGPVRIDSGG